MSEQIKLLLYIKNILVDLIYINSIIATELVRITENTAVLSQGENFLSQSPCVMEHDALNQRVIDIVRKYVNKPEDCDKKDCLEKHVLKHFEEPK